MTTQAAPEKRSSGGKAVPYVIGQCKVAPQMPSTRQISEFRSWTWCKKVCYDEPYTLLIFFHTYIDKVHCRHMGIRSESRHELVDGPYKSCVKLSKK